MTLLGLLPYLTYFVAVMLNENGSFDKISQNGRDNSFGFLACNICLWGTCIISIVKGYCTSMASCSLNNWFNLLWNRCPQILQHLHRYKMQFYGLYGFFWWIGFSTSFVGWYFRRDNELVNIFIRSHTDCCVGRSLWN